MICGSWDTRTRSKTKSWSGGKPDLGRSGGLDEVESHSKKLKDVGEMEVGGLKLGSGNWEGKFGK